MNTKQDDGGPAWPSGKSETPGYENSLPYYEGMSLRDWFAGMALQGIMACPEEGIEWHPVTAAENAWKQADAMLAARKEAP